jgi:hypothetical protein
VSAIRSARYGCRLPPVEDAVIPNALVAEPVSPLDHLRVYPLEVVAELLNCSLSSLVKDCRADRIEHVLRGDRRGMNIGQIKKLVETHTRVAEQTAAMSNLDLARAMSRRAADRQTPRRRTA